MYLIYFPVLVFFGGLGRPKLAVASDQTVEKFGKLTNLLLKV